MPDSVSNTADLSTPTPSKKRGRPPKVKEGQIKPSKPSKKPKVTSSIKKGDKGPPRALDGQTEVSLKPKLSVDIETGDILPDIAFDPFKPSTIKYSHSFIRALAECSFKGYLRKTHAPAAKAFALERGSCAHKLIEDYEITKKDPMESFDEQWGLFVLDNKEKMTPEDQEKIDKGYEDTQRMIREFVDENKDLVANIRPEDVEVSFEIEVEINVGGKIAKRTVVGKIDLVLWNKDRTEYIIIDHKTTASAPGEEELEREMQFCIYQEAGERLFGKPPKKMLYYYLNGQHLCSERFSSVKHPRELGKRTPNCQINYAIDVPLKTKEQFQNMIQNYYWPQMIKWESSMIGKEGAADPKNNCVRCEFKKHCDTVTQMPTPTFLRVN